MGISPWTEKAGITSPNGAVTASINDAWEIAMGAPTSGELKLSNGMSRDGCNPSMVWSTDSEFLAVPQWTKSMMQRLMIISVSRMQSRYAPGEYRVLRLESFDNGVVRGVDSPAHMPVGVEVSIANIRWEAGFP